MCGWPRGPGSLTVSGGTVNFSSTTDSNNIGVGISSGGTANLNSGGTLITSSIESGVTGAGTFNFNGGTLLAGASNSPYTSSTWGGAFMVNLGGVYVEEAGGTIDNGGNNITIVQALQHGGTAATDGGLTFQGAGITTLGGANSYNGPTTINSGTLATTDFASLGLGPISIGAAGTYLFTTTGVNQPSFSNPVTGSGHFNVVGSSGNQSFWSGSFSGFSGTLTIGPAADWWAESSNTGSTTISAVVNGQLGLYDNQSNLTATFNLGQLSGASGGVIGGQPNTNNVITLSVGALNTSTTFSGVIENNWQNDNSSTITLTKVGTGTLTLAPRTRTRAPPTSTPVRCYSILVL